MRDSREALAQAGYEAYRLVMERGYAPGLALPDFSALDRIAIRAWLRAADVILTMAGHAEEIRLWLT